MTWLRIDDGFASNAKVAQLTDAEFRVWMRLLCYCARVKDPTVDPTTKREIPGLSTTRVRTFAGLDLLDEIGSAWEIHDWTEYLPKDQTGAERQARWRARRNASSNGRVTDSVTGEVTDETVTETVTEPLPRARAGARGPVPSRPVSENSGRSGARADPTRPDPNGPGFPIREDTLKDVPF